MSETEEIMRELNVLRAKLTGDQRSLTPREKFESKFGTIEDDTWQWLKEFVRDQGFVQKSEPSVKAAVEIIGQRVEFFDELGRCVDVRSLDGITHPDIQGRFIVDDICHKEDCYGQLDGCEYRGHRLNLVEWFVPRKKRG